MKKGFVIIAVLLSVLFYSNVWAADEAAIQELQTNVSNAKTKADTNALEIKNLKGGLPAEKAAREEADRNLQNEIDALSEQISTCCTQPTPPTIVHNAPVSTTEFSIEITFNVQDNDELAFYAVQSTVSPYINMTSYLEPGVTSTSFTYSMELQSGSPPAFNDLLVIAADTDGTVTKSIVHVEYYGFTCGDGLLNPGEDCDDGNNVYGDGCSAECLIEAIAFELDNVEFSIGNGVGIVYLSYVENAPPGGITIPLSSSNQTVMTVPETVVILEGQNSVGIPISFFTTGSSVIEANLGSISASITVVVTQ